MRKLTWLLLFAVAALTGCARGTIVEERVSTVSVPVTVPCVSGARPDAVGPLSGRFPGRSWTDQTVRQKAANVSAQALRHQNRAAALDAATGACR